MDREYDGEEKLVLLMDIGTTQTACSLIHLSPSSIPKVRVVSRWPGDKNSSKIPTLVYYDKNGNAKAFGAEALDENVQLEAHDNEWTKCVHFKLWLHTAGMAAPPAYQPRELHETARSSIASIFNPNRDARGLGNNGVRGFELAPLPDNVPIEKVYRDWMGYIVNATRVWWSEVNPDGAAIWEKLYSQMIFVLAHPNGWGVQEQGVMRSALAQAVHKPTLDGAESERVVFVTEGEASVHFGLNYTSAASQHSWLSVGAELAVVDGGGSTVDTTVYRVEEILPKLKLREVKPSGCVQAGAIFPTRDARAIIQAKLHKSKYGTAEFIEDIVAQFDTKTKCNFVSDKDADHLIKFGFDRDNDRSCGVSRGRLSLTGPEVAQAFKPSLDLIMESVKEQLEGTNVKTILLSGGFGESPALQKVLRDLYEPGIKVITSDEPAKKAVAEGAGFFYLRDSIIARAARFTFGTRVKRLTKYWPLNLLNVGSNTDFHSYVDHDGLEYQNGGWSTLLKKGEVVGTEEIISSAYHVNMKSGFSHTATVWVCDRGDIKDEDTFLPDSNGVVRSEFQHICDVRADLSQLKVDANRRLPSTAASTSTDYYWELHYKIDVMFGGTSLKAILTWEENGVKKSGPATLIPSSYY